MAGLNECAFNPLCVCGCGSSAPTRVCLDAQICSLSWVSFGLEPATDGSGRFTHLLHRDGSRSTTTPSTSTVTTGTECRPLKRSARCHLAAHERGGRARAGPGRRPLTRVGCGLPRQWRLSAVRQRVAGRLRRTYSGRPVGCTTTATAVRAGARCALFAGGVISHLPAAEPRDDFRPGGGRCTLFAGVVISPFDGCGPCGVRDCLPGGGRRTLFAGGVSRSPASWLRGIRDW